MSLKRHKNSKRPSVSQKAKIEGRSQRGATRYQSSMSQEEFRQRAEAYARMYRGNRQTPYESGSNSSSNRSLDALPHVQVDPATTKSSEQQRHDVPDRLSQEKEAFAQHDEKKMPHARKKNASLSHPSLKKKKAEYEKKGRFKPLFIVLGILAAILLVVTLLLAWNTWFRFNDNADIQGSWYVDGTDKTITITDSQIVLTDSVAYNYTLDTFNKTITFTFSNLQGSGSYAFSPERDTLVITEHDSSAEEGSAPTKLVRAATQQSSQEAQSQDQQQANAQQTQQGSTNQAGEASDGLGSA